MESDNSTTMPLTEEESIKVSGKVAVRLKSVQALLEELWGSYNSWIALRKKGESAARAPNFRRKRNLSTVTYQAGLHLLGSGDQIPAPRDTGRGLREEAPDAASVDGPEAGHPHPDRTNGPGFRKNGTWTAHL